MSIKYDPPKKIVTDVSGGSAFRTADVFQPQFENRDYASATGSVAISTGVVVLTPSSNAVVQSGQVTGYNVPLEKRPDIPEIPITVVASRIAKRAESNARELALNIAQTRDQLSRWFSLMIAAGACGLVLFFAGGCWLLAGSWTAAIFSEVGAAISGFLAKSFYEKDSELRKIKSEQEVMLKVENSVLTAFDFASTIEDPEERNRQKGRIIGAMLQIPPEGKAKE